MTIDQTPIGPQYVLPGAERVTDATMAQRAADAALMGRSASAIYVSTKSFNVNEKIPGAAMTPTQYRAACKALGISIYASAGVLHISLAQAKRYAAGKVAIPEKVAKLLRAMVKLGTTEV